MSTQKEQIALPHQQVLKMKVLHQEVMLLLPPSFQMKASGNDDIPKEQESSSSAGHAIAPPPFQLKASGGGNMPDEVRGKMEGAFQSDFSNVNVHQNSKSATDVGALAYAKGNDVHFALGQFKPDTTAGQELIGHELAHVVQQREGRVQPTTQAAGMPVNDEKGLEKEADDMGKMAAQGKFENGEALQKKAENNNLSQDINVSQKKNLPIQLRRELPSGAPLAELSIDSNNVVGAFENLWSKRPDSYNSAWKFDTPERFADHPSLPDSIRTVCGGDFFRGNSHWSSGWVDDGDTDILWAGDCDIKADMSIYIDNEQSGSTRNGAFNSSSSTTRETATENQNTLGAELTVPIRGVEVKGSAENQRTETDRMTVTGGSSLSMEIPTTTIRADIIMLIRISFRPSIASVTGVGPKQIEEYSPVVGTLLLAAPIQ